MASIWISEVRKPSGKWEPEFSEAMCWQTKEDGESILFGELERAPKNCRVVEYVRKEHHHAD